MTTTSTVDNVRTEPHPILHDFTVVNDVIIERTSRRIPLLIKREERCEYCGTLRFTRINVRTWTQVGTRQYKYRKGVVIVRMPKSEWLKRLFLAGTTLTDDEVKTLR